MTESRPPATTGIRIRRAIARTYWRFSKWNLVPENPAHAGARVIIGAPHTSNWDFVLMLAIAWDHGLRPRWLGKRELFPRPLAGLMRALGDIPVDRADPSRSVAEVVAGFEQGPGVVLVVTPEGTRGAGTTWRSGFYRIAMGAGVPVSLGFVDRDTMTTGIGPTITLTGNVAADMDRIRAFYADKSGVRPQFRTEPRLRDEDSPHLGLGANGRD